MTRNYLPLAALAGVIAILCWPLVVHTVAPVVDLPNHMARQVIAVTNEGPLLDYFEYRLAPVPNLAADVAWFAVHDWIDIYRFSQITMVVYASMFMVAVAVLARIVHGRWTLWPLAAGLVVFNGCFFWGFQNFLLSVPFQILSFALWLWMEPRDPRFRALCFLPLCLILYLMHFFAFAFFATVVIGREVQRLIGADARLAHLAKHWVSAIPFLLPLALLLYVTGTAEAGAVAPVTNYGPIWIAPLRRILAPFWGISAGADQMVTIFSLLSLLVVGGLLLTLMNSSDMRLRLNPRMRGPVFALLIVVVVMPEILRGVAFADFRYPFLLVAMVIAGSSWENLPRQAGNVFGVLVAAMLVGKSVSVEQLSARHNAEVTELRELLQEVPPGARIMPIMDEQEDPGTIRRAHLQALAVADSQAFVPTLFQGVHALVLRPEWHEYGHPAIGAIRSGRI